MKYAISDIHGCLKTFKQLLKKIDFNKTDELFLLGDYIDRGPNSKGVIDFIWELSEKGFTINCLRGNHEQMLLTAYHEPKKLKHWEINGGLTTLESFHIKEISQIPRDYIDWIHTLHFYTLVDNYILVHAGLNFKIDQPLDDRYSMLWIRKWHDQIDKKWLGNNMIVHGHTTQTKQKIESYLLQEKCLVIDIDGGCVFSHKKDKGHLCAFDLSNQVLHFQKNIDN